MLPSVAPAARARAARTGTPVHPRPGLSCLIECRTVRSAGALRATPPALLRSDGHLVVRHPVQHSRWRRPPVVADIGSSAICSEASESPHAPVGRGAARGDAPPQDRTVLPRSPWSRRMPFSPSRQPLAGWVRSRTALLPEGRSTARQPLRGVLPHDLAVDLDPLGSCRFMNGPNQLKESRP